MKRAKDSKKAIRSGLLAMIICLAVVLAGGCIEESTVIDDWQYGDNPEKNEPTPTPKPAAVKVDDWQYDESGANDANYRTKGVIGASGPQGAQPPVSAPAPTIVAPVGESATAYSAGASGNLGFSTGGAKDINNFRENIENGHLPLPTDVTYEGLFYDYYFDTGQQEPCDSLFCPSYSYAVTEDPFSGEVEYYLAVGLNSGMKESDFERKNLNLVIVLDISGSMGSPFDRYYYDRFGNRMEREGAEEDWSKTKMEIATESVAALLDHLNEDDRFGMVLFDGNAHLAKPLNPVGETDMGAIEEHILDISARGSTNLAAGMAMGTDLFDEFLEADQSDYENRIIFLTDAMPNTGDTSERGLLGMARDNSEENLYSTFIGIGVDFNTELIEYITKIKGANYYSVHSAKEFEERMDDEFEYMVTPLVFDLELELEADGWEIEKVFGSPEADEATGELMKVNTLFPSKTEGGQTRGGLVLLKLKKLSSDNELTLTVSYEGREGNDETVESEITLEGEEAEFFANTGIRKGVLLSRYASLLVDWMIDEREHDDWVRPWKPMVDDEIGIPVPPPEPMLGKWERQSMPLTVSEEYEDLFEEFMEYFEAELEAIGDDTLEQELDVLDELS
ncbi:MAG: VWA domain-containing protein [Dehalococcoidia bacterium]